LGKGGLGKGVADTLAKSQGAFLLIVAQGICVYGVFVGVILAGFQDVTFTLDEGCEFIVWYLSKELMPGFLVWGHCGVFLSWADQPFRPHPVAFVTQLDEEVHGL
jgi:hypothetical protein